MMDMKTMTMYFYSSTNVVFLNQKFHVYEGGYYTLALLVTFIIAFAVELCAYLNYRLEFSAKTDMKQLIIDEGNFQKAKSRGLWFRVVQFGISICRLFASYILKVIQCQHESFVYCTSLLLLFCQINQIRKDPWQFFSQILLSSKELNVFFFNLQLFN